MKKLLFLLFLVIFSLALPTQASASENVRFSYCESDSLPLREKSKKGKLVFQRRYNPKKTRRVPLHRRFYISIQNHEEIYGKIVGFSADTLLIKDVKNRVFVKIPIQRLTYISRESKFLQKLVENTWFCLLALPLGVIAFPVAIIKDNYEGCGEIGILIAIGGIPMLLRELFKMDYDLRYDWYLTIKK